MSFFPNLKWLLLGILLALFGGWLWGLYQFHAGVASVKKVEVQVQLDTSLRAAKVDQSITTIYIPTIQQREVITNTLIQKVPIYVPEITTTQCTINNGFVSLWNAANQMRLPDNQSPASEEASAVKLPDVAAQHIREMEQCHANEDQLNALIDWIEGQRQAADSK